MLDIIDNKWLVNLGLLSLCLAFIASAGCSVQEGEEIRWSDRVIPLPKEMHVADSVRIAPVQISYQILAEPEDVPTLKTVTDLLDEFAKGDSDSEGLAVSVVDLNNHPNAIPRELNDRLQELPNSEQAYAIFFQEGSPTTLTLAAHSPKGLLYAARTLNQLVTTETDIDENTSVVVPLLNIVDWPDLKQRGEWAESVANLSWLSQWKLNMHRVSTVSAVDDDKEITDFSIGVDEPEKLIKWASDSGHIIIPYLSHIEFRSARGWVGVSPRSDNRARRYPGFDWSDPGIQEVLERHMRHMAELATKDFTSNDIEIWLSEWGGYDEGYYVEEAEGVIRAYERVSRDYPELRLRVLLSQGSREENARIIELLGAEGVGVTYYDVAWTYTAERRPMILPELEELARSGGFVDVYPIIAPNYFAIFPGSMPQFIQYRGQEFVEKNLQAATTFSYPDKFHYELNMAAWGEYTWNANGRSPYEFSRAYATVTGIPEPELFAEWAIKNGEAAWTLAHLNVMSQFARHGRFTLIEESDVYDYQQAITDAKEAIRLARQIDNRLLLVESEAVLAGLVSAGLSEEIDRKMRGSRQRMLRNWGDPDKRKELTEKLEQLNFYAQLLRTNVYEWDRIAKEKEIDELSETTPGTVSQARTGTNISRPWVGIRKSATGMLRASDRLWAMAESMGVKDTRTDMKPVEIAEWTYDEFDDGAVIMEPNISELVSEDGGFYNLGYQILEGSDLLIRDVSIMIADTESGEERVIQYPGPLGSLSQPEVLAGYEITNPKRADDADIQILIPERNESEELYLRLTLSEGGAGSKGSVNLRRVWTYDDFPWDKYALTDR